MPARNVPWVPPRAVAAAHQLHAPGLAAGARCGRQRFALPSQQAPERHAHRPQLALQAHQQRQPRFCWDTRESGEPHRRCQLVRIGAPACRTVGAPAPIAPTPPPPSAAARPGTPAAAAGPWPWPWPCRPSHCRRRPRPARPLQRQRAPCRGPGHLRQPRHQAQMPCLEPSLDSARHLVACWPVVPGRGRARAASARMEPAPKWAKEGRLRRVLHNLRRRIQHRPARHRQHLGRRSQTSCHCTNCGARP